MLPLLIPLPAYAFGSEGRCRPGPATAVPATATAGQGVPLHRRWRGRRPRAMSSRQARRARAPPRLLRRGAGPSPDTRGASPSIMVLACRRGRTGSFPQWAALSPSRGGRVGKCDRLGGVANSSVLSRVRSRDLEMQVCRNCPGCGSERAPESSSVCLAGSREVAQFSATDGPGEAPAASESPAGT